MATINGTAGNDVALNGTSSADTINGLAGDDVLTGAGGNDILTGGAGADTFSVTSGTDTIKDLGDGDDVLVVGAGATVKATAVRAFKATSFTQNSGIKATITAAGYDIDMSAATGSVGYTVTNANSYTNVSLTGSSFNDVLTGGYGSDNLVGGDGNDTLSGGGGNDTLVGGGGNDTLSGGAGNDTLTGGAGDDKLTGGGGIDTASYANAAGPVLANLVTAVATGDGNDTLASIENLTGGSGDDQLTGNSAANVLDGGAGNDILDGGSGNDTLVGGLGDDTLTGGLGTDTASYAGTLGSVYVSLNTSAAQNTVSAGVDRLTTIENLIGSDYSDQLTGSSGNNVLNGGAGHDVLLGLGGNDTLYGGAGYDILTGGAGNDVLNGEDGVDKVSYLDATSAVTVSLAVTAGQVTGGSGTDTLTSIEQLDGSKFNDALTGSNADNLLFGDDGNDTLIGGLGNDGLYGDDGNDTLIGGAGQDYLSGGAGIDTVSYASDIGPVNVDLGTLARTVSNEGNDSLANIENAIGGSFNDSLIGSDADNVLIGGAGNDTLIGGQGHDTLDGGLGNDTFFYRAQNFSAGQSDTLVADVGDRIVGIDASLLGLTVSNQLIYYSPTNVTIGSKIDAENNISFSAGHLQIDLNNDHQFKAADDFDAGISGVGSVVWDATADNFIFGAPLPPPPASKVVALTFDDGPGDIYTQQVLDILNFYNVDATFFVVGQEIEGHEQLIQSMVDAGHLVENHSWNHTNLSGLSSAAIEKQFSDTSTAIANITHEMPDYYRPPYGAHNDKVDTAAAKYGMQPVNWTIDTNDWDGRLEQSIIDGVLNSSKLADGAVILMHDGGGDRSQTVAALDNIIVGLQQMGYAIATMNAIKDLPVGFDGVTIANANYTPLLAAATA